MTNDINIYSIPHLVSCKFANIFKQFKQHFPNVNIHINESTSQEMIVQVQNNPLSIAFMISNDSFDQFQASLPQGIKAIYYRPIRVAALAYRHNSGAQKYHSISCQELLQKPLIVYAPKGVENTFVYRILAPYGKPNIKYAVDNGNMFASLMESGSYYTIGDVSLAEYSDFIQIPIEKEQSIIGIIVIREDGLQSFIMKSFVNIMLAQQGKPILH